MAVDSPRSARYAWSPSDAGSSSTLAGVGWIPAASRHAPRRGLLGRARHARNHRRRLDASLAHPRDHFRAQQPLNVDPVTRLGLDRDPHHLRDIGELRDAEHLRRLAEPRIERRLGRELVDQLLEGRPDVLGILVERDRHVDDRASPATGAVVGDLDQAVRDGRQRAVVLPDRRGPEVELLDRSRDCAGRRGEVDRVADVVLALEEDEQAGERVPHDRLRAEPERDPNDARRRDDRRDVDAEVLQQRQQEHEPRDHDHDPRKQADHRRDAAPPAPLGVVAATPSPPPIVPGPASPHDREQHRDDDRGAEVPLVQLEPLEREGRGLGVALGEQREPAKEQHHATLAAARRHPAAQAVASSSARWVRTLTRARRQSEDATASSGGAVPSSARADAAARSAPPSTSRSTPVARSGVSPMLVRATRTPRSVRTADTPTRAQSCARRLNFRKLQPSVARGTRISVSTSVGASAVSNSPVKNDPASIVRRIPPAPATTNVASSARSTAGMSPAGSPWATEPPIVPTWRTAGSPICAAANAMMGHAACSSSLFATSWCRASAPIAISSPSSRIVEKPSRRPMSISVVGRATRKRIAGNNEWPPASSFASSSAASAAIASSTDPTRTYANGAGITRRLARRPGSTRRCSGSRCTGRGSLRATLGPLPLLGRGSLGGSSRRP